MRRSRAVLASAVLLLSGCGYVHFGRLPPEGTPLGDAKAAQAYSDLATEHKILKQELVLARRETDTLRTALERTGAVNVPTHSGELAARLSETAAELAALRASHAKLQAERSGRAPAADGQLRELAEKLSASQREQTQLQSENARLRGEVERVRAENAGLAERLTAATARYDHAQAAVSQLNAELLAQKDARGRVEQSNEALRAQLATVMAQSAPSGLSALQIAKAPPAGASATVELRIDTQRVRDTVTPAPAPPAAGRKHLVRAGDTLEKIAQQYYGAPDRWPAIYGANSEVLGSGQPLRAGMELTIPE